MPVCRPRSGSRALMSVPAAAHATVVQRWIDAGLVIFGKTNTPEFGRRAITEPVAWGPTRNPWDLQRTPGGSSGGSAAAVAAGIVPCAGANDGGGSIRIPAACCGLVGLKPGRGLTPSGPGDGRVHARGGRAGRRVAHGARYRRDARRHRRRRTVGTLRAGSAGFAVRVVRGSRPGEAANRCSGAVGDQPLAASRGVRGRRGDRAWR